MGRWWTLTDSDDCVLHERLDKAIPMLAGRADEIATLHREHSPRASSCAAYIITLHLIGGGSYQVLLKDFSASKRARDIQHLRAVREVGLYHDWLSGAQLGTPLYLGSEVDEKSGRCWLLLEWVEGRQLRHCDFRDWQAGAAWLARFHRHFEQRIDQLNTCRYLQQADHADLPSLAAGALAAVSQALPLLAPRLVPVVARAKSPTDSASGLPRTLLHGSFRPQQIIIAPPDEPTRICVVDWEAAEIGSGLRDFAELTLGVDEHRFDLLLDAYCNEAERYDLLLPTRSETRRLVNYFRLRHTLRRLHRPLTPKGKWDAHTLVAEAEELGNQCL